ncbi:hypothetical protein POTOM_043601 [Populus tomentosa]|uniref:Uncharacterized protein n=1 Tax=Populus tomentosa TaxID=118781 RepID=A0A8X8C971_POPTO|nr:hypothetical protein POTOM_043601 [Populus tomentosa]
MKVIILRSNNFNDSIPEEICRLASLQILDLAHNKLSGNIPRCINNFSAMTTMSEHSSNGISYSISMGGFYENAVLVMKRKIVEYGTILNILFGSVGLLGDQQEMEAHALSVFGPHEEREGNWKMGEEISKGVKKVMSPVMWRR